MMTASISFTLQGHFLGRLTQITWTDGNLSGDPQLLDLVKRDAAGYEGHLVRSTTPGESTMTNHLSNPYVACTLMGRWFAEQQPEMIAGSLPEIGPLAGDDSQIFTEELDSIQLYNPYPRQSGGRFGFGPGTTTGGTGRAARGGGAGAAKGAKGTKGGTGKAKSTTAKAKAAATTATGGSAGGTSSRTPTVEEQKAAAEQRLKNAQKQANKANRDFNKAERDAAAKQIANADEIKALQEEHSAAYIRQFNSYSDTKNAIAEERAIAKGEAGKTKTAVTNYEKMQAAKQPYEDAKAQYAAAKATSDASKAVADELQSRYSANYDFTNYGAYNQMLKDHPDLKAAQRQQWKDESVTNKAQTKMWRAQSKYTTPRDALAGKITDAEIQARPEYIAAKAALDDVTARLGEANGQTALRAAFDARASARLELKDAQSAMLHPTWKYTLNTAPTSHAIYTNLDQWSTGTLEGAHAAAPSGQGLDPHIGDPALSELERAQGFNGKPDIVNEADLVNYINGGETELWRGDTKLSHTDEMMMGEYHAGLGIRGNGTYAQQGADGHATARSYASQRGQTGTGKIMRMSVKADARVITYDDLKSQAHSAFQRAQNDEQSARARGDTAGVRRAKALQWLSSSDTSRFAAALGYDAIRITSGSGTGQWIILNRTSVRISHQIRGG